MMYLPNCSLLRNCRLTSCPCLKPIGWNFATSGSSNIHVFNNRIVAVSDTGVSGLVRSGSVLLLSFETVISVQHVSYWQYALQC